MNAKSMLRRTGCLSRSCSSGEVINTKVASGFCSVLASHLNEHTEKPQGWCLHFLKTSRDKGLERHQKICVAQIWYVIWTLCGVVVRVFLILKLFIYLYYYTNWLHFSVDPLELSWGGLFENLWSWLIKGGMFKSCAIHSFKKTI